MFANPMATLAPVLVDERVGVLVHVAGRAVALMVFSVADGTVVAIDATTDRQRLASIRFV